MTSSRRSQFKAESLVVGDLGAGGDLTDAAAEVAMRLAPAEENPRLPACESTLTVTVLSEKGTSGLPRWIAALAPQGGEPDEAQGDADAQADDERPRAGG